MAGILAWITANSSVLVLSLAAMVFLLLLVFLFTIRRLNKTAKRYKTLVEGAEQKNLEQIVLDNTKALRQVMFELNIFRDRLEVVEEISAKSVQKIGLQRFNAFEDIGGEMSYAVAFLTKDNDGVVISSIFARDEARTYCKQVKGGKSQSNLSVEEQKAIRRALGFTE